MSAYSPRLPDTANAPAEHLQNFDDLLVEDGRRLALRRRIRHLAGLFVQAIVLVGLILLFFYRLPQVDGQSMEPQLTGGEHVLIDTLAFDFRIANPADADRPVVDLRLHPIARGDLIAFEHGSGDDRRILLKRVVALGGDTVAMADGRVWVDGRQLAGFGGASSDHSNLAPLRVAVGQVFVLGDNRAQSDDSRAFGPVAVASVVGRATLVVWPLTRVQRLR